MREKRWLQWYWMPTTILLIGMISFSLLVWVNHINERQRINSIFVETLMDIQIHTATAHLWLEQAVSGDKDVDVDGQILAGMEQSINLANVLLNGGRAEHGLISVLMKEPDKQAQTKAIISLLQNFKSLALMRLRSPGSHGIGSPADRQIDEVFKKILGKAGRLEDIIENNIKSDLEKSQRLYLGILAAWMFIVIVATGGGWSRERRRKIAEEALLKANVQLRSQAEELTEHRERLSQLVDVRTAELTNANELLLVENVQRKRMEDELQKAKETAEEYAQRLDFALVGSNDATWEWDIITDQVFLNARYYEMTGYTHGEVDTSFSFYQKAIHPDDVSEVKKQVTEHLEGKTGMFEAQYRLVTKSGKIRNVMGRGKVVMRDDDGRPIKIAGVITDITEMKRLGEEVSRIHNLESIGLLAGGLSHDFNNVLNIIYGNITFAKMLAESDTAIAEPLTDAEEACERAKELGIRLRALAQGSSPVKKPIMLAAIIEDVAETLFKGSNISHSISEAVDLIPVEADPRQIRQVFENLLTNAKEAMSAGGSVKIELENCVVNDNKGLLLGSDRYVCISLQDDGKGIPEEHLPKIFNPYFSTKDTYSQKGLGIGLTTCHAILKSHSGHISVESQLGVGTRVTIYLPASAAETALTSEG